MSHPDHQTLFESANQRVPAADVAEHLQQCARCRDVFARLKGGAALLREARASSPDVDFSRMDDVLAREAESVARSMRVLPLRPARPWGMFAGMGLTLAAATGVALWVRAQSGAETGANGREAQRETHAVPQSMGPSRLASRVTSSRGEVSTHADALDDGAVLTTGSDGNATVALNGNWQLELPSSSEIALDHVDDPSAVTLERGEVSVRPTAADGQHHLAVHARRWTVDGDGALTARAEFNRIRVTVLSGRITTQRGPLSSTFTGPVDLSLPDSGERAERIEPAQQTPTVVAAAPTRVPSARPTAAAEPAAAPAPEAAPTVAPSPLDAVPADARLADAAEQRYVRAQARTALSSCINACRDHGTCAGPVSLAVLVDANGQVSRARAQGDISPEARACFEREARTMAISAPDSPFRFEFTVDE